MDLPVNLYTWTMAFLPIIVLLALLVKFQWGVAQAAPVGLAIAMATGMTVFGGDLELMAGELAKGVWGGISVMAVVVPAILIFEVTNAARAFEVFRRSMQRFTPNELLRVLAVGWVLASFLQGVTGFGVPVAVVAPLLIGMGMRPFWAVTVPLVCHAWANTFGTLAVAWEALVIQTGIEGETLWRTAFFAALFTWIMNITAGLTTCWFYGGRKAIRMGLPAVAAISLLHGGGQMILSQFNPTLANFLVSSLGLVLAWLLGRTRLYNRPERIEDSPLMDRSLDRESGAEAHRLSMHQAFTPYYILIAVTLFVLLIPPVKRALGFLQLGFSFPETATAYGFVNPEVPLYAPISVFTHAGVFLLASSLLGYLYFKRRGAMPAGAARTILANTMDKAAPATIAVILMIAMSKVMGGTGQVLVLAQGTASATGQYYGFFAPFIGVLGAFMTSSNMASNILFGGFQQTMAEILALPMPLILGAQTGGGAIGNVLCPGNILLGTTTAGILGAEGKILKIVFVVGCAAAAVCGVLVLAIQNFW